MYANFCFNGQSARQGNRNLDKSLSLEFTAHLLIPPALLEEGKKINSEEKNRQTSPREKNQFLTTIFKTFLLFFVRRIEYLFNRSK